MAAVMLSPYGGAARDEIDAFPGYAGLTPMDQEAPAEGPWHFWRHEITGVITLAFDKPGAPGAVHVAMELEQPPELWWNLARGLAQVAVLWLPDARHPTSEEMAAALQTRSGWVASARYVPPVELR